MDNSKRESKRETDTRNNTGTDNAAYGPWCYRVNFKSPVPTGTDFADSDYVEVVDNENNTWRGYARTFSWEHGVDGALHIVKARRVSLDHSPPKTEALQKEKPYKMTPEQAATFVYAQAVALSVELAAMQAHNATSRENPYQIEDYAKLLARYEVVSHNGAMEIFNNANNS